MISRCKILVIAWYAITDATDHSGLQTPWHTLALVIALSLLLASLGKLDGPQLAARYAQKLVTWSYAVLYEPFKSQYIVTWQRDRLPFTPARRLVITIHTFRRTL